MVRRDHSPRRSTAGGDVLAYAEAADAAALAAPEDAEVFTKLAVASRVSAADAGDPRQADLYGEIAADCSRLRHAPRVTVASRSTESAQVVDANTRRVGASLAAAAGAI